MRRLLAHFRQPVFPLARRLGDRRAQRRCGPHPRRVAGGGGCWLACELYHRLGLDVFLEHALPPRRKGTRWDLILQTLVCYRLLDPGSEWHLHRQWFVHSAMADLLGGDFSLAESHKLYRVHDHLLAPKEALCSATYNNVGKICSGLGSKRVSDTHACDDRARGAGQPTATHCSFVAVPFAEFLGGVVHVPTTVILDDSIGNAADGKSFIRSYLVPYA